MPKPSKIVISPGQGLLLLIDHYKEDAGKVDRLKKLYLCGAENEDEANEIKKLLEDALLSNYRISYNPHIINDDPTRRYFETHLTYQSLKNGLSKIDKNDLENHFGSLKKRLPEEKILDTVKNVLKGDFNDKDNNSYSEDINNIFKEYSDYIRKIRSGKIFGNLSTECREKIELLVKCSFLGVINAQYTELPLDIYGRGIFSKESRGKILVQDQKTTRNQNLGIMKGHMPIALDDIARSEEAFPYLKPSDQASFVEHASWVKSNFKALVHPFCNSISGTFLCQLRLHAKLRNDGKNLFTDSAEKFSNFSQLFISVMSFNSGGHTLHEFTAPFLLDVVKAEFSSTKDFEKINLESMYLTNNQEAFDIALKNAIDYNRKILLRKDVRAEIVGFKPINLENKVLSKFKVIQELNRLSESVSKEKEHYENKLFKTNKNIFLQKCLDQVMKHMDNGNLYEAKNTIKKIKQEFEKNFGKTDFFGQRSKSFEIIESVENELARIQNNLDYDTNKLQKKAVHEELIEQKLGRYLNEGEDELTVRARNHLKPVKDRLDKVTSLDQKNKAIDKAYIFYTSLRKEIDESQEQYNRRIKGAEDILIKKLDIKLENINDDKRRSQNVWEQIKIKMAVRQEEYRLSLFCRGKGTLAERLDKAWECYNNTERTIEDRYIAQSYLIFVLDVDERHIIQDLNTTLQTLMLKRELLREQNPEYIPGKSPVELDEKSKGNLKKTKEPGVSDDEVIAEALRKKKLLDVNAISRKKDSGEATGQKTEFFDAQQRDMLRVLIRQGKFVTPEGKSFDTSESISKNKKELASITLNVNGELSVFQHRFQEIDGIAHSSMNAAMPVFFAGEVRIKNGKLLGITDRSGHYAPNLYNVYKALDYFKKQGIDISETIVYSSSNPGKALQLDIHRSKDHPQFYELNAKDLFNSYGAHLKKMIKNIQSELEAYKTFSFKKFLQKVKDFFLDSTLTKDLEIIADQLAKNLVALTGEINSANTLDALNVVNVKINQCIETAHKENVSVNQKYDQKNSCCKLAQHISFFRAQARQFTNRLESAIKTNNEKGEELSEEDILSCSEKLKMS